MDGDDEEKLSCGKVRSSDLPYMKNMAMYNDLGSPEQPLVKRINVVELLSVCNF